jgi:hypothetical protein
LRFTVPVDRHLPILWFSARLMIKSVLAA